MNCSIGLNPSNPTELHRHINLKLAELGMTGVPLFGETQAVDSQLESFIAQGREKEEDQSRERGFHIKERVLAWSVHR